MLHNQAARIDDMIMHITSWEGALDLLRVAASSNHIKDTVIAGIATTIIAALCLAGILAALKSRWLYVIAPKLYLNTPLSDGQIVSLTLTNAGLLPEEDVALTFRSACKFELVATSKSTLAVSGKTISLPKLSRGESVSVLLLVEGKAFDQADIDSVESKGTKGKVVDSKEKVTALWQHFVVFPLLVAFLAVPFVFGTSVGSATGVSAWQYVNSKLELIGESKQLAGFKSQLQEDYSAGKLASALKDGRLAIDVREIVRRGDILTITIRISNGTGDILSVDASVDGTAGGRGPLDFSDSRADTFAMTPGEAKTLRFKVFQPEALSVQLLQGSYRFKVPSGGNLSVSQTITL